MFFTINITNGISNIDTLNIVSFNAKLFKETFKYSHWIHWNVYLKILYLFHSCYLIYILKVRRLGVKCASSHCRDSQWHGKQRLKSRAASSQFIPVCRRGLTRNDKLYIWVYIIVRLCYLCLNQKLRSKHLIMCGQNYIVDSIASASRAKIVGCFALGSRISAARELIYTIIMGQWTYSYDDKGCVCTWVVFRFVVRADLTHCPYSHRKFL